MFYTTPPCEVWNSNCPTPGGDQPVLNQLSLFIHPHLLCSLAMFGDTFTFVTFDITRWDVEKKFRC